MQIIRLSEQEIISRATLFDEDTFFIRENPYGNVDEIMKEMLSNTPEFRYLSSCLKTWNVRDNINLQVANAGLGLIGELFEYFESPSHDELGDVLYYRALLRYLLSDTQKISSDMSISDGNFSYDVMTSFLADVSKKVAFHDRYNDKKTRNRYSIAMEMLDAFLLYDLHYVLMLDSFDSTYEMNINKLSQRHPKGFKPNYDSSTTILEQLTKKTI